MVDMFAVFFGAVLNVGIIYLFIWLVKKLIKLLRSK
jgi:hypothetical protein